MSEAEKPKRKFWQFHLLTLVLIVLASGGMIAASLHARSMGILQVSYGWPLEAAGRKLGYEYAGPPPGVEDHGLDLKWKITGALADFIIAVVLIMVVAVVSELLLRRREARKK